ncbi:hypothetical protein LMIY3S_03510 [Labrys miyagiensis]
MMKAALTSAIAVAGMLVLAGSASADKLQGLTSLQGAWVEQSMSCDQVYSPGKRGMAFRKDVSVFAPAFMISGRRIRTPGASCSIQGISYKGDRMILNLGCTTTITSSPVKAYLSAGKDGELYRYNDDVAQVGSRYDACKP